MKHPMVHVERHSPVLKGLRHIVEELARIKFEVERHCPVLKGLRRGQGKVSVTLGRGRKTLPCSKGIETAILVRLL